MGELTGNWKLRRPQLEQVPLGLGYPWVQGSYAGGAGLSTPHLGYVMGSINAHNSIISVAAFSMLSMYFGSDGLATVGYKIVPVGQQIIGQGSIAYNVYATASISGSVAFFVPMALTINATTTSTYLVSFAAGASISANFTYWGFIVSTP